MSHGTGWKFWKPERRIAGNATVPEMLPPVAANRFKLSNKQKKMMAAAENPRATKRQKVDFDKSTWTSNRGAREA